ncbi:MAG: SCO family protein [Proteobacteria bacterium]|nr:SCO family protein [Pseudomonadota bacterium]
MRLRAAGATRQPRVGVAATLIASWIALFASTTSADVGGDADPHAAHRAAIAAAGPLRSIARYRTPDVELTRDDGQQVGLGRELDDGRPVVLAFIYTSCTTVCPVTSQTLAQVQARLGAERARIHLMSISIDPEQDTPARLREYAQRFHAGPEWQHYTGTRAASEMAQRAFNAYRGSKMDHQPVILVRSTPTGDWVRFDGFATADQLLAELPVLHASR